MPFNSRHEGQSALDDVAINICQAFKRSSKYQDREARTDTHVEPRLEPNNFERVVSNKLERSGHAIFEICFHHHVGFLISIIISCHSTVSQHACYVVTHHNPRHTHNSQVAPSPSAPPARDPPPAARRRCSSCRTPVIPSTRRTPPLQRIPRMAAVTPALDAVSPPPAAAAAPASPLPRLPPRLTCTRRRR